MKWIEMKQTEEWKKKKNRNKRKWNLSWNSNSNTYQSTESSDIHRALSLILCVWLRWQILCLVQRDRERNRESREKSQRGFVREGNNKRWCCPRNESDEAIVRRGVADLRRKQKKRKKECDTISTSCWFVSGEKKGTRARTTLYKRTILGDYLTTQSLI